MLKSLESLFFIASLLMILIHLTDLSLDRGNVFREETDSAKDALLLSLRVALDLVLELLDLTLNDRVA